MSKRQMYHSPEQIVSKLRDADVMLNSGKHSAAVLPEEKLDFPNSDTLSFRGFRNPC